MVFFSWELVYWSDSLILHLSCWFQSNRTAIFIGAPLVLAVLGEAAWTPLARFCFYRDTDVLGLCFMRYSGGWPRFSMHRPASLAWRRPPISRKGAYPPHEPKTTCHPQLACFGQLLNIRVPSFLFFPPLIFFSLFFLSSLFWMD
jgi:hypothetical protein